MKEKLKNAGKWIRNNMVVASGVVVAGVLTIAVSASVLNNDNTDTASETTTSIETTTVQETTMQEVTTVPETTAIIEETTVEPTTETEVTTDTYTNNEETTEEATTSKLLSYHESVANELTNLNMTNVSINVDGLNTYSITLKKNESKQILVSFTNLDSRFCNIENENRKLIINKTNQNINVSMHWESSTTAYYDIVTDSTIGTSTITISDSKGEMQPLTINVTVTE